MIVYLKCQNKSSEEPHFLFHDLLELHSAAADTIKKPCFTVCLPMDSMTVTFSETLLGLRVMEQSVMLGKTSGVGQRLLEKYPTIITPGVGQRLLEKYPTIVIKVPQDLAFMYDVLEELAITSNALQKCDTTLVYVDKLIRRSIRYIQSMKERKGGNISEVPHVLEEMKFRSMDLTDNGIMVTICCDQFLTSLIDRIRARMLSPISNT